MPRRPAPPKPPATLAAKIEVAGVRAATFKLVGRAADSYLLYRSSRKLGTARVEEDGRWTAQLGEGKQSVAAIAASGADLLKLIGTYILAGEARAVAARPVEESNPQLRIKGRKSAEERLSIAFAKRAQAARLADLDDLLARLRKSFRKPGKT